jgi:hypothetical protein
MSANQPSSENNQFNSDDDPRPITRVDVVAFGCLVICGASIWLLIGYMCWMVIK